ncbi:retrovirus-related pol polyprotein from transposon TNT 1-94 [Tanacetum coccineum]
MTSKSNNSELTMILNSGIASSSTSVMKKGISQNFSSPYTPEQNGVVERKNKTLIEAARTMLSRSVFSKQYWTKAVSTACYTQNRSTIVKRHLKTPYEIFHKRIPNINFLYVFGCPVYIHNHKDHLGKFDEKADDGYLLGYSLVSKAFRVFNIRRQQTEETYHITFNESPDAIKFSKPSVDNINIAENKRYPLDEYLHPYDPSQRIDYRFIGTLDAETRRQKVEEISYGIRDVWVDPTEAVEERVDGLVKDGQFYYETARLLDQEALVSREAWAYSCWDSYQQYWDRFRRFRLEVRLMQMIARVLVVLSSCTHVPPRRSSATARAAAAAAATPMTTAVVEQLIEARVSVALANHETL